MIQKLTTIAIIGSALALAACNTVRGAGKDVQSAANCSENVINNVHCSSTSAIAKKIAPPEMIRRGFFLFFA